MEKVRAGERGGDAPAAEQAVLGAEQGRIYHPRLVAPQLSPAPGGDRHAERVRPGDSLRGRARAVGTAAGRREERTTRGGAQGRNPVAGAKGDFPGAQQSVAAGLQARGRRRGDAGREPSRGVVHGVHERNRREGAVHVRSPESHAGQRGAIVAREDQTRHRLGQSKGWVQGRRRGGKKKRPNAYKSRGFTRARL